MNIGKSLCNVLGRARLSKAGSPKIRASWNRKVDHPDQYLWEAMASAPELGCIELNVPARSNGAQRIALHAVGLLKLGIVSSKVAVKLNIDSSVA